MRTLFLTAALLLLATGAGDPPSNYYVYVAAESEDVVYLVRFDGEAAKQRI